MNFPQQVFSLFTYLLQNKEALIGAALSVVGSASALIWSLQQLTDLLAKMFPKLAVADGFFNKLLAALAAVSHWGPLNGLALNPSAPHAIAADAAKGAGAGPNAGTAAKLAAGGSITALLFVGSLLRMFAVLFVALLASACAHVPVPVQQLIDCGQAAVTSNWSSILTQVTSIFEGGTVDIGSALARLGTLVGGDAVVCTVQQYVNDLAGKTASRTPAEEAAYTNAKAWLASQNSKATNLPPALAAAHKR